MRRSSCAGRIFFRDTGIVRSRPRKRCARDGFTPAIRARWMRSGNWRIVGRIKNLIVLGSGHKISPEAIEDEIARDLAGSATGGCRRQRPRISFGDCYGDRDARSKCRRRWMR